MREFGDSYDSRNIPSELAAMLPVDGDYAVTPGEAGRFPRHRWYTVTGDYRRAGAIDWELHNPCFTPPALRGFVRGRAAIGKRARVYVDRADSADAVGALRAGGLLSYPGLYWWIPTLDGRRWTAGELAADLAERWGAAIPAARLWANQYVTISPAGEQLVGLAPAERRAVHSRGAYDLSDLFGEW